MKTSQNVLLFSLTLLALQIICLTKPTSADEHTLDSFRRQSLTTTYFSEGTNVGDLNGDGKMDVVYGPYWFEGPSFASKHEIYKPIAQPTERYADNFFCWTYDFNGDQLRDILVVGFPGTPAYVYENPGAEKHDAHWPKHEVFDWVSNESPQWTNLVGDARPELVCSRDGFFGYVQPDWDSPFSKWKFHRISDQVTAKRFGHGLGVGDINGDQRLDVLVQNGWYEQPSELGGLWDFHPFMFTKAGGADMFAYDVDGDGDNDVITSIEAHGFGLAWFEQIHRWTSQRDFSSTHDHGSQGCTDNEFGVALH